MNKVTKPIRAEWRLLAAGGKQLHTIDKRLFVNWWIAIVQKSEKYKTRWWWKAAGGASGYAPSERLAYYAAMGAVMELDDDRYYKYDIIRKFPITEP